MCNKHLLRAYMLVARIVPPWTVSNDSTAKLSHFPPKKTVREAMAATNQDPLKEYIKNFDIFRQQPYFPEKTNMTMEQKKYSNHLKMHILLKLVIFHFYPSLLEVWSGWWFEPIRKICSSNGIISPGRGENKKTLKPPPIVICSSYKGVSKIGVP